MSHFVCETCGTAIIDTTIGYKTGCEHYPPDIAYSAMYGAFYSVKTRRWVEAKCGDVKCARCRGRPMTADHLIG